MRLCELHLLPAMQLHVHLYTCSPSWQQSNDQDILYSRPDSITPVPLFSSNRELLLYSCFAPKSKCWLNILLSSPQLSEEGGAA